MTRPSDCVTQRLKTRVTWQKCSAVPRIGFLNSCFPLLVYPHHTGEPSPGALLEAGLCIQRDSFHFSVEVVANYTDFINVATCTNLTVVVFTRSPQLLAPSSRGASSDATHTVQAGQRAGKDHIVHFWFLTVSQDKHSKPQVEDPW